MERLVWRITTLITVLGATISAFLVISPRVISFKAPGIEVQLTNETQSRIQELQRTLATIQKTVAEQVSRTDQALEQLTHLPPEAGTALLVKTIDERTKDTQQQLKALQDVIVQDPQKSMTLVLVKKDLDALQRSIDERVRELNAGIERLYNILGWSIGALLIAVLGQLIAGLFARRQLVT
jgi:S-adenosylhomocysteine hydrolase